MREGRDLLRLLTILETMTNNNKVGSNVDLICKHNQSVSFLFLTKESYRKQLYLSPRHRGLGDTMNYRKVDNNYTKGHDRWRLQFNTGSIYVLLNLAKSRSFYVEFYMYFLR